jgi:hypothetical protein
VRAAALGLAADERPPPVCQHMSESLATRVRSLLPGRRVQRGADVRIATGVLVCFPDGRLQVTTALRPPAAGEELAASGVPPGWIVQRVHKQSGELRGDSYDVEVMVSGERRRGGQL